MTSVAESFTHSLMMLVNSTWAIPHADGATGYPITILFWARWFLFILIVTASLWMWHRTKSGLLFIVAVALNSAIYLLAQGVVVITALASVGGDGALRAREALSLSVPLLEGLLLVVFIAALGAERGPDSVRQTPACHKCRAALTVDCEQCPLCGTAIAIIPVYRVELKRN